MKRFWNRVRRNGLDAAEPQFEQRFQEAERVIGHEVVASQHNIPVHMLQEAAARVSDAFMEGGEVQLQLPAGVVLQVYVKWHGIGYNSVTWEAYDDVQGEVVAAYFRRRGLRTIDPATQRSRYIPRPPAASFTKVTTPRKDNAGVFQLRDYQLEGVNWLEHNWVHRRNSLLADEMGLGKTVQTLAFLSTLRQRRRVAAPFLVVAPLSTIPHWLREAQAWTDFNAVMFHGDRQGRAILQQFELYHHDGTGHHDSEDGRSSRDVAVDLVVTTYVRGRLLLRLLMWVRGVACVSCGVGGVVADGHIVWISRCLHEVCGCASGLTCIVQMSPLPCVCLIHQL